MSYINFSEYTDSAILSMQKEKKKEYIILIQSEKIAKKLLNHYGESLYTTNYHYRVNTEYYLLQERVAKKKIVSDENPEEIIIKVPLASIIARLNDSKEELLRINQSLYPSYSAVIDEIIDKIKCLDLNIQYQNGDLYFVNDDERLLVDDEAIENLLLSDEKTIKK